MDATTKPLATTGKKLLTIGAIFVTGAALVLSQNLTNVQASEEQNFIKAAEVSAGETFATVIASDGTVYSRGWNSQGQLGITAGQTVNISGWNKVELPEKISSINSPYDHSVATSESGHIFTWGPNDIGQSGNGTTNPTYTPTQVTAALRYDKIAAGADFTLALDGEGRLWSWGNNDAGQLGDGTNTARNTPGVASTDARFADVYAGKNFSFARTAAGELYSWGNNDAGQLGDGTNTARNTPAPTAAGNSWNAVATNIQSQTVLALSSNGYMYSWGENAHGELGIGTDWRQLQVEENERVEREIARIKANDATRRQGLINACVAAKVADARAAAQAEADRKQTEQDAAYKAANPTPRPTATPTPTPNPTATPAPTRSPEPTVAPSPAPIQPTPVDPDDYVAECTTQVDATFQATDTSGIKPAVIAEPALRGNAVAPEIITQQLKFTKIALGSENGYAIDALNRLYAWGSDADGQTGINVDDANAHTQVPVSILAKASSITAGNKFAAAVSTTDVYVWGKNTNGELLTDPAQEAKVLTPQKRASGYDTVVAGIGTVYATTGTTVRAWGDNTKGQLGANSTEKQAFAPVDLTSQLRTVAPYNNGAVGLDVSNQLVGWGQNTDGEFGNGAASDKTVPAVTAKIIDTFKQAKAGYLYTLAVDETGQMWGWGSGESKLLGPLATANSLYPVPVPIGSNLDYLAAGQQVAIAASKDTVFIWGSSLGDEVQQYPLAGVKQVAAGNKHVLALTEEGKLWNWGDDSLGVQNQEEQRTLTEADTATSYSFVAAGNGTTFGITTDGELKGWGDNANNVLQLNSDQETQVTLNFEQISIANGYALGVDTNGVVWGWGSNSYNVLGSSSTQNTPYALPLISEGN